MSTEQDQTLYTPKAMRPGAPVALTLGCMNFGKRTPEAEAARIVEAALAHGIVLFDTANAYGDGESERITGRLLKPHREHIQIATKVGWWKKEGLSKARILEAADESLQRLQSDWIDLYYLHVPDHETPIEQALEAMAHLLSQGKIKRWGVSNYASWQILEMFQLCQQMGLPRPALSQQIYNPLIRQLDYEYWRFASRYQLPTTVYNPLAGGLLTAKGLERAQGKPQPNTRFHKNPLYQRRYLSDVMVAATAELSQLAQAHHLSLIELTYRWLASHPQVDSLLLGPGELSHLTDAFAALSQGPLEAELLKAIDAIWRTQMGTDASYAR